MIKQRMKLTFPPALITEPVLYRLGTDYNVVTNIRRADVQEDVGWVVLEVMGNQDDIDRGLAWIASQGVRVDPIDGDIVQG